MLESHALYTSSIIHCLNLMTHTHALYFFNNVFYGYNFSVDLFGMSSLVSCMILPHNFNFFTSFIILKV
jgi:hypothetical protein